MTPQQWEEEVEQIALRRYDELQSLKRQASREKWSSRFLWLIASLMTAYVVWRVLQ